MLQMRGARLRDCPAESTAHGGLRHRRFVALRCLVTRGLVKEVEEELNKFLTSQDVNVVHMAQSETGEYISVTLIYEDLSPLS